MKTAKLQNFLGMIAIPTAIMIWASFYFLQMLGKTFKDRILIEPVFYAMLVLYIINTIADYKNCKKNETIRKPIDRKILLFVASIIIYISILSTVGFIISTLAFMFGSMWLLDARNKILFIVLPIFFTALLYLTFQVGFSVPLPKGILPF